MEHDTLGLDLELEQFTQDAKFFDEHRSEYHQEYPNQAIAVYKGIVIAHADNLGGLMTQLDELAISRSKAYVGWALSSEAQNQAEERASAMARSLNSPNR